jgi:hypothetical protein
MHAARIATLPGIVPRPGDTATSTAIFLHIAITIARGRGVSLASSRQTHASHTSSVATPRGAIAIMYCIAIRTAAIGCTTITTTAKDLILKRPGLMPDMPKTLSSNHVLPLLVLQLQIITITPYAECMNDERMVE